MFDILNNIAPEVREEKFANVRFRTFQSLTDI